MKHLSQQLNDNVHLYEFEGFRSGQTVSTLFCSDIHLDSIGCKREILKNHFDEIKKADGLIFIFGDLLDVMATYGDRRLQREDVDLQFIQRGRTYLDCVLEYTINFLKPYAKNIALISKGNHETVISKFHNIDLINHIVYALNMEEGAKIQVGQYSGFIMFRMAGNQKTTSRTKVIHYHHGFGGSAKRSKGILDVQIEAMKYPDAEMLVRGHTHQKWYDPSTTRMRLTDQGRIYKDKIKYIQSGSYVDGIGDGKSGWAVEKNFNPTDIGGWFVDFTFKISDGKKFIQTTVIETPVEEF